MRWWWIPYVWIARYTDRRPLEIDGWPKLFYEFCIHSDSLDIMLSSEQFF
jgi:hypothetical protein